VAVVLALLLVSCNRAQVAPADKFREIRSAVLHGQLVRARREADLQYRRFEGHDQEWAWQFRLLEGDALASQGLSQDILSLLAADLPQSLANSNLSARKHMLQSLAYSHLGDFPSADQNLREAQRICDASNCESAGEVARIAGVIAVDRNDPDTAESCFRKSLQIARQRGDQFLEVSSLLNLGVVAIGRERFDESVQWSSDAQRVARIIPSGLDEEKASGNLGWAYYKMGDFDRSLIQYADASRKAGELGVLIDQVEWLNNLGLVYFQTGQLPLAENYYRQSLALAQKSGNRGQVIAAVTALAYLSIQTNQLEEAKQYSQQAFQLAHGIGDRTGELPPMVVEGQIAARLGDTQTAERILREASDDPKSDASLRWEAQDDLAKLYEDEQHPDQADNQYRKALASFESARLALQHDESRLPFLSNATGLYDDYLHFLIAQGRIAEALELADYGRAQTLTEGLGISGKGLSNTLAGPDPKRIAAKSNSTILYYWLGTKASYRWTVTSHRITLARLPPAAEINEMAEKYRSELLGPRDVVETQNSNGSRLFDLLVGPAAPAPGRDSRVVIIPDGSLNNLNFETLLVAAPKSHYWIEDVTVVNASSLRLLAASHRTSPTNVRRLLLMGDAVPASHEYQELPEAGLEVTNIAKHFTSTTRSVYTRADATPPAYLASAPERFDFIHFVAHGTSTRLSPLDSAVILSKASADEESFKLYARDIVQHPLHAELVTISTCYGAGTRSYAGEGLVGLSWAFLRAGAHNVIGALWEVSDTSTPHLMDELYSELQAGRSPEVALRSAKLALLHSNSVFRKPFYWAPFQLYSGS
jgi:CHAT domain-containing protein